MLSKLISNVLFISQSELPGFYDPCVGEEKSLQIDYIFSGINHRIVIKDNEPLRIPKANVATPGKVTSEIFTMNGINYVSLVMILSEINNAIWNPILKREPLDRTS